VCGQIYGAQVRVDSTAKVAEIEIAEQQKMKEKVGKILAHNINVFINRQLIYNYPEQARARCLTPVPFPRFYGCLCVRV
jgi:T-complex protein 1 subunit beta